MPSVRVPRGPPASGPPAPFVRPAQALALTLFGPAICAGYRAVLAEISTRRVVLGVRVLGLQSRDGLHFNLARIVGCDKPTIDGDVHVGAADLCGARQAI